MRQMCDWCRLLYAYRTEIKVNLLEKHLKRSGLKNEWKAFASVAVNYLGMPAEVMSLYTRDKKWNSKAEKIVDFVLKGGEWHIFKDIFMVGSIFPLNTLKFMSGIILNVNWLKIKERVLSYEQQYG